MSNFKIEYVYEIIDKFSPVALRIKESIKGVDHQMKSASESAIIFQEAYTKKMENLLKTADKFKHVGQKMSMWVTAPIIGVGAIAIHEYGKQEEAIKRVEVALKGSALAGKVSADELYKNAEALMRKTGADEDAIMGVTQRIVTMRGITKETAMRIQNASVDVAQFLGTDASGAIEKMQKVFMGNARALKDMNINLSPQQKKTLEHLRNTNQQEKVRLFLLERIEEKVKGQAEAGAKVGTGPLKVTMALLTDMLKQFGEPLLNFLNRNLFPVLQKVINILTGLSPVSKGLILFFAGALALVGPLTLGMGMLINAFVIWEKVTMFIKAGQLLLYFTKVTSALRLATIGQWLFNTALFGCPIVWIIAGLTALGYGAYQLGKHWDYVSEKLQLAWNWMKKILSGDFSSSDSSVMDGYAKSAEKAVDKINQHIEKTAGKGSTVLYRKNPREMAEDAKKEQQRLEGFYKNNKGVLDTSLSAQFGLGSLHSSNKSQVDITLHAPKETVKHVTTKTTGSGLKLGYNMGGI